MHKKISFLSRERDELLNQIKKIGKDSSLSEESKAEKIQELKEWKKRKTTLLKATKERLNSKLDKAVAYNNMHQAKRFRRLSDYALVDKNVVSVFASTLTRTFEMATDQLSMNIIVVRVFYVSVLEDIIVNGFKYKGEEYCFFSASAGQIRQKKGVFVKKALWLKYEKTLMCGLTIEDINNRGGININKFLAYLALSNSATEIWHDFDIGKTIVIDDFVTTVNGTVDFIDDIKYTVERKQMGIEIEHSDGCGIMLPSVSSKNKMVRAPFIKGLLAVFDFRSFIQENCPDGDCTVKDIYGKEHKIIADDIQVIFTKSQFKLWKYYDSWEQYTAYFKKYNCEVGYCNEEDDHIKDGQINYQMLQSLHSMTNDELKIIANKSKDKVDNISTNIDTMLDAIGANKKSPAPFQTAAKLYPELLQDEYFKKVLREKKASMVQAYRSGRLEVNGKYLFLVPDMYAACQQWFLGQTVPKGLLADGEVFCRVYKGCEKVDVLRSPHLYKEHAVKQNVVDEDKEKWFVTDAIYTSSFDLISKYLMFDNDGDKSLVVADKTLIECAERHMKGVVPLYYDMKKAGPNKLSAKVMFDGMNLAYKHSDIGSISNDITKIWNQDIITEESLLAIKYLCCDNNFSIDAAKTLYMPTRTAEANALVKHQVQTGLPHFFIYVKGKNKKKDQVAPINKSTVNRITNLITNRRITYKKTNLDKLDYRILMRNRDIEIDTALVEEYFRLNCTYHFKLNHKDPDDNNLAYIAKIIKTRLSEFGYDNITIADMLVKYSHSIKNGKGKAALWFCYGDIIVENIENNLNNSFGVCCECGRRFIPKSTLETLCYECKDKYSNVGFIECCDCGVTVAYEKGGSAPKRCPMCAEIKQRYWQRNSMKLNRRKTRCEVN